MSLNKKIILAIWSAGTLSVLAVLPYAFALEADLLQNVPFSLPVLALLSLLQSSILLAIAASLGLFFARKVGFEFPILERLLSPSGDPIKWKDFLGLPITLGILTAAAIAVGNWLFIAAGVVLDDQLVSAIPVWKRFLASFYGGVGEETLMRLFLVSLFVWIFSKITRSREPLSRSGLVWPAIVIVSILFGLGHLPATAAIAQLTPLVIARAIVLNGLAGLVLGWLYWKKGFEAAVVAHFTADFMILIVLPLIAS